MPYEVKLPYLGDDAPDKAKVSFWYLDPGQKVKEGDDLVEMITDKASFTVPSPASGSLKERLVGENDVVAVGQVMAIIDQGE